MLLCCAAVQTCHILNEKQQNTHAINPIKCKTIYLTVLAPLCLVQCHRTAVFLGSLWQFYRESNLSVEQSSHRRNSPCEPFTVFWGLTVQKGTLFLKRMVALNCFSSVPLLSTIISEAVSNQFLACTTLPLYQTTHKLASKLMEIDAKL